jgi:hypothetical protein
MTNFKILLRDGKLMIGEFPEPPVPYGVGDEQYYGARMDDYNAALEAAKASAVEIINPVSGALYEPMQEGKLYDLPTGWTVEYEEQFFSVATQQWVTATIQHLEPSTTRRKIARLVPSSKASGIAAIGVPESGDFDAHPNVTEEEWNRFNPESPVIPEGSEKPDFDPLKPFTREEWQAIADKHTPKEEPFRFVKGSVVVPGAWLEGEMVGYARCMIDMYYPLLDKSADKPAIDDTLKGESEDDFIDACEIEAMKIEDCKPGDHHHDCPCGAFEMGAMWARERLTRKP